MLQPVILCGGSGTRLWPLSRQLYPKQFLPLIGDQTLLQATIDRLEGLDCAPPIIVCHEDHRFIAAEQLRQGGLGSTTALSSDPVKRAQHGAGNLPGGPIGRGLDIAQRVQRCWYCQQITIWAARRTFTQGGNGLGSGTAAQGTSWSAFGITPGHPATGYGYIKAEAADADQVLTSGASVC